MEGQGQDGERQVWSGMPRGRRAMSAEQLLELLRTRERSKSPLVVIHSEKLPATPEAVIEAAQQAGRAVVHVRFARSDGNGMPSPILDK